MEYFDLASYSLDPMIGAIPDDDATDDENGKAWLNYQARDFLLEIQASRGEFPTNARSDSEARWNFSRYTEFGLVTVLVGGYDLE